RHAQLAPARRNRNSCPTAGFANTDFRLGVRPNDVARGPLRQWTPSTSGAASGDAMKWLWLGFAVFWAISIVVDSRRRDRVVRSASIASAPPPRSRDPELPALLLPRSSP